MAEDGAHDLEPRTTPARVGGDPHESVDPRNALGEVVIGSVASPASELDQRPGESDFDYVERLRQMAGSTRDARGPGGPEAKKAQLEEIHQRLTSHPHYHAWAQNMHPDAYYNPGAYDPLGAREGYGSIRTNIESAGGPYDYATAEGNITHFDANSGVNPPDEQRVQLQPTLAAASETMETIGYENPHWAEETPGKGAVVGPDPQFIPEGLPGGETSGNETIVGRPAPPPPRPGAPARRRAVGEPVDVADGSYVEQWVDFHLEGTIPVVLARFYGALLRLEGPMGPNRTSFLDRTIEPDGDDLLYRDEEGRRIGFAYPFDRQEAVNPRHRHLRLTAPWLHELALQDRHLVHAFDEGSDGVYRLTRIEDRCGNRIDVEREGTAITRVRHSDGFALHFENDDRGLRTGIELQTVAGRRAPLVRYAYDEAGRLTEARCETSNSIRYAYDERGRLAEWCDTRHTRSRLVHDEHDRVVRTETSGAYHRDVFEHDPKGRVTVYRPGGGEHWQRFETDTAGDLLAEETSTGERTEYTLQDGYPVAETDALGHTVRRAFDEWGNPESETDAEGRITLGRWGTRGELGIVVDHAGAATRFEHDHRGLPVRATDPEGAETLYRWTAAGRLAAIERPDGTVERRRYDAHHRLVAVVHPGGGETRLELDDLGRPTAITDPEGRTTRFRYDPSPGKPLHEPTRIEHPDSSVEHRRFDSEGLLASVTDAEGRTTHYEHGAFDLPREIVEPDGATIGFEHDVAGRLTAVVDAAGRRHEIERDGAGRVVAERGFDGRALRYERDRAGRVVRRHAPDGGLRRYAYDRSGLLTRVEGYEPATARALLAAEGRPDGPAGPAADAVETFAYDAVGRLSRGAGAAEVAFEYDRAGRVTCETGPHRRIRSRHDAMGRRVERTIGEAPARAPSVVRLTPEDIAAGRIVRPAPPPPAEPDVLTRYAHDARGALTDLAICDAGSGALLHRLEIRRDATGLETARRAWAGDAPAGLRLDTALDALGRPAEQAARPGPRGPALHRRIRWGRHGAPEEVADGLWGAVRYAYDAAGQVLSAKREGANASDRPGAPLAAEERYAYARTRDVAGSDPAGRAPTAWTRTAGGTLTAARGPNGERVTYERDACGRVVMRRVERAGFRPRAWRYGWDALDRLVRCETPEGVLWAYAYDPLDRRVEKRRLGVRALGQTRVPLEPSTAFAWDGDTVAEAIPLDEAGAPRGPRTVWHHEPGGFVPLARETHAPDEAAPRVAYAVCDHLGTPRELVSPQGALEWAADTHLWGARRKVWQAEPDPADAPPLLLAAHGAAPQGRRPHPRARAPDPCPIGFQGQWHDPDTGLCYNRHRHYDPLVGEYASPDPIGLEGGLRPQGYVHQPTGWVDPLGLQFGTPDDFLDHAASRQNLTRSTLPGQFKEQWTHGQYKYEVRGHPADPQWGQTGDIYRVSRQRIPVPGQQGTGAEYLDPRGQWHHTSSLREKNKDGSLNPLYNCKAAASTHVSR